jgi:WD40 repeat protein
MNTVNVARTRGGYVSVGTDRVFRFWDSNLAPVNQTKKEAGSLPLVALATTGSGDLLITATQKIAVRDAATGKKLSERPGHGKKGVVTDAVVLRDDRSFVTASRVGLNTVDNSVIFWTFDEGGPVRRVVLRDAPSQQPCEIERLARAPHGDDLFAVARWRWDGTAGRREAWYVFHIAPGAAEAECIAELSSYQPSEPAIAVGAERVFVTNYDRSADQYAIQAYAWDGTLQTTLPPETGRPALAAAANGTRLIVADSMAIRVYDADGSLLTSVDTEYAPCARAIVPAEGKVLCATTKGPVLVEVPFPPPRR